VVYQSTYERHDGNGSLGSILFRVLLILLLIAYLVLAPRPLDENPTVHRIWTRNTLEEEAEGLEGRRWIPFVGEKHFGYLSEEGELLYREETLFHVAITEAAHVNYSRMGQTLLEKRPIEEYFFRIEGNGYPVYRNGLLYLISHDRMSLSRVGESGEVLYRLDFASLITSFDAGDDSLVVGLLNGRSEVFAPDGAHRETLQAQEDGGPVYSVAVSPQGDYTAVQWGAGPQYLSIFSKKGEVLEEVERFSRERPILWEGLIRFSTDQRLLFCETVDGLSIIDIEAEEETGLRIEGSLFDVYSEGIGAPLYVTGNSLRRASTDGKAEELGFLHIYTVEGAVVTKEWFDASISSLFPLDGGIVCATGDTVLFLKGGGV